VEGIGLLLTHQKGIWGVPACLAHTNRAGAAMLPKRPMIPTLPDNTDRTGVGMTYNQVTMEWR
jgi:hypothetical protein